VRHALLRIGAVAAASGTTALALLFMGRVILVGDLGIAMPSFPQPTAAATPTPSVTPSPAVLSETATPNPSPTPTPTPEPSPTETAAPTPSPLGLTAFRFGGRSYVGVVVSDADRTFVAPFAGRVEIQTYQFIDGEVRVGSNVAGLAFYPYVSVVAPDRKITYRPGMLGAVSELLARDGTTVAAGDPLFRLITLARSSWTVFYNSSAPYQVVVSLQSMPSGRDLDATVYLGG
jgi:multidrug efflux pump subunit AcrA (membrane-fusion protein)